MIQRKNKPLRAAEASAGAIKRARAVTGLAIGAAALALMVSWGCSPGGPQAPAAAQGVPATARISADPNPVPAGPGLGKTTITWNTGSYTAGQVYVLEDGSDERLFGHESNWSSEAPWIRTGSTYEFRLYAGTDRKNLLGKVVVTRDSGAG
jgi:hypothetical protein